MLYNSGEMEDDRMKQMLNRLCEADLSLAWQGRKDWLQFVNQVRLGERDYAILFPSLNRVWNDLALLYADDFAASVKAERLFLLTHDEHVKQNGHHLSRRVAEIIPYSREQAVRLMKFYSLYMFTDQLIIASLNEPDGRDGERIVGRKGISIDEVFAVGVYRMQRFTKREWVSHVEAG